MAMVGGGVVVAIVGMVLGVMPSMMTVTAAWKVTKMVYISRKYSRYINKILVLYDNLITLDISVTRVFFI